MVCFQSMLTSVGCYLWIRSCGDRNGSRRATVGLGIDTLITMAPAIAIAKTVIFWSCYPFHFLVFFRPPIFRRPWADFRETMAHNVVCPEIVPIGVFIRVP